MESDKAADGKNNVNSDTDCHSETESERTKTKSKTKSKRGNHEVYDVFPEDDDQKGRRSKNDAPRQSNSSEKSRSYYKTIWLHVQWLQKNIHNCGQPEDSS